ncbi:MAG TPA: TlpA disulfide reductase family protein [Kofleriaceae bacterium]|nr:TlpA disulfide reductase family protein [Kofleriaceae bacterium]
MSDAAPPDAAAPSFVTRLGLAVARPRWALAIAGDRAAAGRSGTDFVAVMLVLLLATQLRGIVGSVWLGAVVDASLGLRALTHILTRALTLDLGFLVIGALLLFAVAGAKRNLGRAFDLACVAALPLLLVDLGATVIVRALDVEVPPPLGWALAAGSWAWTGALLALASRTARVAPQRKIVVAPPVAVVGKRAGWGVLAVAMIGIAVQASWILRFHEALRPVEAGQEAPPIVLPAIEAGGTLGAPVSLAASRGQIVVVDFWATWCKPCLEALPRLEALHRRPDVVVLAVNLDDPEAARAMFDQAHFTMQLVADDGQASERYAVTSIPHTVVIDREGHVVRVARGAVGDLAATIDGLEQIRK